MKKFIIVMLSMLLVMSLGQVVLAQNGVGLNMTFAFDGGSTVGGYVEYAFTDMFSLAFSVDLLTRSAKTPNSAPKYTFDLSGKFTILSGDKFNIGAQADIMWYKEENSAFGNTVWLFEMGPGIFADYIIYPKFKAYLNANFKLFIFGLGSHAFLNFSKGVFSMKSMEIGLMYDLGKYTRIGISLNQHMLRKYGFGIKVEAVF